jgi:hypothetical protein
MHVHPTRRLILHTLGACALLAAGVGLPARAAVEAGGIPFEDTARVAGKDLKLNGAGVRTKVIIKVYAAGLYLPERRNNVADILREEGPRRVAIVMARDVSSDTFGKAFMDGLNDNVDKAEKARIASQIGRFGEVFALADTLHKGDVLHLDWIPGSGTQCELNGKKLGEPIPDLAFYNAVLRIWLGEKPVDGSLKSALLGNAR